MKAMKPLVALFLSVQVAPAALADSSCGAITNDATRLSCYDRLYRPIEHDALSAWKYEEYVDKFDDRTYASAHITSEENNSLLMLRCGGITPELRLIMYRPITYGKYVYIKYRLDDLPASEMDTWPLDSSGKSTGPIESARLLNTLKDNSTMIITAHAPQGGGNLFATFALAAFSEAREKVAGVCANLKRK